MCTILSLKAEFNWLSYVYLYTVCGDLNGTQAGIVSTVHSQLNQHVSKSVAKSAPPHTYPPQTSACLSQIIPGSSDQSLGFLTAPVLLQYTDSRFKISNLDVSHTVARRFAPGFVSSWFSLHIIGVSASWNLFHRINLHFYINLQIRFNNDAWS